MTLRLEPIARKYLKNIHIDPHNYRKNYFSNFYLEKQDICGILVKNLDLDSNFYNLKNNVRLLTFSQF